MTNSLMKNFNNALQALYDHVGFKEDWVVYPIDDRTDAYWNTDGRIVKWAETLEDYNDIEGMHYYSDDVYTQRFYDKWIYEGKELTMIFCDPHTDGMKWFRVFDNSKRMK
ncbi:MAG: hypothetical protein WC401_07685 [Bacteroidales bacterium]|jgi:hypothetical protein